MPMKELGERIHEARETQRKTMKALALDADVSAAYIQKLENAEITSPSPLMLKKIADALGLEYMELMVLAEYVTPVASSESTAEHDQLSYVLRSANLSDDQRDQVARFIRVLKLDEEEQR